MRSCGHVYLETQHLQREQTGCILECCGNEHLDNLLVRMDDALLIFGYCSEAGLGRIVYGFNLPASCATCRHGGSLSHAHLRERSFLQTCNGPHEGPGAEQVRIGGQDVRACMNQRFVIQPALVHVNSHESAPGHAPKCSSEGGTDLMWQQVAVTVDQGGQKRNETSTKIRSERTGTRTRCMHAHSLCPERASLINLHTACQLPNDLTPS